MKQSKTKKNSLKTSENYNEIYSNIVKDESDFLGKIAYSIYKKDKYEWIHEQKKKLNKEIISNEELKQFHNLKNRQTEIENYRTQATTVLTKYSDEILLLELKNASRKFERSFWGDIVIEVFGAFIVLVIGYLILFCVAFSNMNSDDFVKILTDDNIKVVIISDSTKTK